MKRLVILLALLALPATAQERITPEEFLAGVIGKTASFYDLESGDLVGVEQFLSSRLSVWRGSENKCVYGEITTPEGQLCFLYRDLDSTAPTCWYTYTMDGELMVLHTDLSEREIQVARFDGRDLGCPETPLS